MVFTSGMQDILYTLLNMGNEPVGDQIDYQHVLPEVASGLFLALC